MIEIWYNLNQRVFWMLNYLLQEKFLSPTDHLQQLQELKLNDMSRRIEHLKLPLKHP